MGHARPSSSATQHARVIQVRRVVIRDTIMHWTMRGFWGLVLAASFAAGLTVSWQRWASPVIDSGREMNQPLRLAEGQTLYSDVRHIYGPFSPWLNAQLYRAFGPSLDVLYGDGIISSILILALVYLLARRLMDQAGAATATISVMWLCAIKPAGNFILPYSYAALHGTLFGLIALSLSADAMEQPVVPRFFAAGLLAGLTVLAKTEMGLGAMCGGVVAALLAQTAPWRRLLFVTVFVVVASAVPAAVYAVIAARVGWSTLVRDSWVLLYNVPEPVRYFNRAISGFDRPLASLARMLIALAKLAIVAGIVASLSYLIAGPRTAASRALTVLVASVGFGALLVFTTGLDWDRGPFLAMPLLLLGVLVVRPGGTRRQLVTLYAAFALAQLARILLHARSGGAYGAYLMPMSIVVFVYLWLDPFPAALRDPAVARVASSLTLGLLLVVATGTAVVLAYRYHREATTPVSTVRGTMIVTREEGLAWNEALAFIDAHSRPGDPIAVLPEGTSLTFFSGRRNPLQEEIVTPGYLDAAGEVRAIRQIDAAKTQLVLIVDRPTREFGAAVFGRDYNRRLMAWIASTYTPCGIFGPTRLVTAYCRR